MITETTATRVLNIARLALQSDGRNRRVAEQLATHMIQVITDPELQNQPDDLRERRIYECAVETLGYLLPEPREG